MLALIPISAVLGALFRRFWGGWCSPDATLKRVLGFLLPLSVCFLLFGFSQLILSFVLAGFVLFGWLMPYHGYGASMGRWEGHPLWACILVMSLQYGGLTALAGTAWHFIAPNTGGLIYTCIGLIVPFVYWLGNELWERFSLNRWGEFPTGNWFIDGAGAYNELVLGSLLVGGIPFCNWLSSVFN